MKLDINLLLTRLNQEVPQLKVTLEKPKTEQYFYKYSHWLDLELDHDKVYVIQYEDKDHFKVSTLPTKNNTTAQFQIFDSIESIIQYLKSNHPQN